MEIQPHDLRSNYLIEGSKIPWYFGRAGNNKYLVKYCRIEKESLQVPAFGRYHKAEGLQVTTHVPAESWEAQAGIFHWWKRQDNNSYERIS